MERKLETMASKEDVQQRQEEVRNELSVISEHLQELKDWLKKCEEKLDKARGNMEKITKQEMEGVADESRVLEAVLLEMEGIEKRRNSLIIRGLPESEHSDLLTRKAHDMATFMKLCSEVLETDVQIVDATRLGTRTSNLTRPLRIVFGKEEMKIELMNNRRNLKDPKITISLDLTPGQYRLLRKERDTRNERARSMGLMPQWHIKNGMLMRYSGKIQEPEK